MKELLRIAVTFIVLALVYGAEGYVSNAIAHLNQAVNTANHINAKTFIEIQEWHRAMSTLKIAVPIMGIIILFATWWEPLKQLLRKK